MQHPGVARILRAIGRAPGVAALVVAAVLLGFAPDARAQVVDPDLWTPNGYVNALARIGDTLYVGGGFDRVGPWTGSFVALDSASAVRAPAWPRVDGDVRACLPDGRGGFYLGGAFTRIAGVERRGLAHLRADGTLDAWNPGPDGPVSALARLGGSILVGGLFSRIAGQAHGPLAAVDTVTGALAAWDPGPLENNEVCALAVDGNTVYVGGWFTSLGGQPRNHLAALDAATGQLRGWNPDANLVVYTIVPRGKTVYVGGGFTTIHGDPRSRLAEVDSTTGIATDWDPGPLGLVYSLVRGASTMLVGGSFAWIGGQSRTSLAEVSLATGQATAWQADAYGSVRTLVRSGAVLYAGGDFVSVGGVARPGLAAIDATSGALFPWSPPSTGLVQALGASAGRVFVGGRFATCGGLARSDLAALDLKSGQPVAWSPVPGYPIFALATFGSTVFASGSFPAFMGQPRGGLAAVDATTGALLPWDAHATATFYPSIRWLEVIDSTLYVSGSFSSIGGQFVSRCAAISPTTGAASAWKPGPDGDVEDIEKAGSTLYVAGQFTTIGGRARNGLAAVDATTGTATSWNPATNSSVKALVLDGSRLLAAGTFTQAGGQVRNFAAAVDTGTAALLPWNPNSNYFVGTLLQAGGTVYAGGEFSLIGGQGRIGLAALDAATGAAQPWDPHLLRTPDALVTDGTSVYVGSSNTDWLGSVMPSLTRLLPAPSGPPSVTALAPPGGDTLVIGDARVLAWSASAEAPGVQSVDLYVSRSGASGPWELVAAGAPNTGHYDWNVTGPESGSACFLRVDARDFAGALASDVGEQPFAILGSGTPALITLFRAIATEGGVRIEWQVSPGLEAFPARVDRAAASGGPWSALEGAAAREGESWTLLDRGAGPGRWWYRLDIALPDGARVVSAPVGIDLLAPLTAFGLSPLAPNPSNGAAALTYEVPHRARVRLSLFDVQGREVAVLLDRDVEPGRYGAALDARDLPAGLYFLRLRSTGVDLRRRVAIAR